MNIGPQRERQASDVVAPVRQDTVSPQQRAKIWQGGREARQPAYNRQSGRPVKDQPGVGSIPAPAVFL